MTEEDEFRAMMSAKAEAQYVRRAWVVVILGCLATWAAIWWWLS